MLFGLVCITFVVSNVAPSDPAALAAGPDATRDMVETIRREYGLDRPLPEQFVRYVGGLLTGDLGRSIVTTRPVTQDLARYFPATLELVLLAMGFGVLVGVPLGMVSAVLKNQAPDHATRFVAVSLVALPAFWFVSCCSCSSRCSWNGCRRPADWMSRPRRHLSSLACCCWIACLPDNGKPSAVRSPMRCCRRWCFPSPVSPPSCA
ncbi:MAG TPA: ABC transporter permease [Falsiroseomonas sp.]|nr:ABC transporter permease [Falsiroseomonas sp.]